MTAASTSDIPTARPLWHGRAIALIGILLVAVNLRTLNAMTSPIIPLINQSFPIAHESGSLASRFGGDNLDAAGKVRAKTGWIDKGYTLAGIIQAKDGSTLLFAVYAHGEVKDTTRQAIDNLVTGFYRCGDQLANEKEQ